MTSNADERPFPPGSYPVVVVGSGAGGLQVSYSLSRLGVDHAVISADDEPAGMFRRFPLFQRLITWTKPYAPAERGTREYERYDWNSLIGEEPGHRALMPGLMDGTSYFPSRPEMEAGLRSFAEVAGVRVRYGCTWERTRRDEAAGELVLGTSDGEYRSRIVIFAIGMTEPWTAPIPGLDRVPHYVETKPAREYAGKRVFVVGKRNSGFEVADGLLPLARQVILGSPRPVRLSIMVHSTAAARARYLQPYEDHVLAGGTLVLDVAIDRVEPIEGGGWRVHAAGTTRPGEMVFDVDDVIAATGFRTPLGDLPQLGVATFFQGGRLPAQTPYWESPTIPGIYFAGNATQGSIGMKKYGIPSNSAAVHGFRYNARVLAEHIARTHFGIERERPTVRPGTVVGYLLKEATTAPELWNQQSYLARVIELDAARGITDAGIRPLEAFVDEGGPDAVAVAVETDADGDIHPAVYVRRGGRVQEYLLPSDQQHDFAGPEHRAQLDGVIGDLLE
jgi:thioredoxin reductase